MSKLIVVRISEEMHAQVRAVGDDREVPFRDALDSILRAGVSRIRALDRHAMTKKKAKKEAERAAKKAPRK